MEAKSRILIEGKNQTRYLLYLPKGLAEDTMFPFKGSDSMFVRVSFEPKSNMLLVEKWIASEDPKLVKHSHSLLSHKLASISLSHQTDGKICQKHKNA